MEYIYKGTTFDTSIQSSIPLKKAVLFNHATKDSIVPMLILTEGSNGVSIYSVTLSASDTTTAAVGVYDLEIYSGSTSALVMAKHITNYATVVDTSLAN